MTTTNQTKPNEETVIDRLKNRLKEVYEIYKKIVSNTVQKG